jgi:ribosomal protein S20
MPITSSAKKALRASQQKRVYNLRRKSALDGALKEFRVLLTDKKVKEAEALMPALQKAADKAAKTHYIKPNAAARIKSRAVAALLKVKNA